MSILARISNRLPFLNQRRTALAFYKTFGVGADQVRVLWHYLTGKLFHEYSDEVHLKATMEWLAQAQEACGGNGVSNVFRLGIGWGEAYPETSGYILVTYLVYANYSGDKNFVDRAVQIGNWEIDIQAPNGGIFSSVALRQTRVFNTGQVILGWCALFERTGDAKYLQAAIRAGDYLLNEQEVDGTWRRDTYCGARTYHAGVDWGLLRLAELSGERSYAAAAVKNLRWVLEQQLESGWFDQCGFDDKLPIMHVIVYTLRGLLESSLTNNEAVKALEIMPAVIRATDALCRALQAQPVANIRGMVPTSFDKNWHSPDKDSCLTGNVQLAYFLYRLSHLTSNQTYKEIADNVVSATKRTQIVGSSLCEINGAMAGTYPMTHGYVANGYPNWAAKFFADALLMKINYEQQLVIQA